MIQQGEGQNLRQAAHLALVQCMGVSGGEKVLVITDEELREIGYAFWKEAKDLGAEAIFVEMIARSQHGEEPPEPVIEIMKAVDVIMAPTSRSLSHTGARRKANEAGARVASMPGITRDSAIRTLTADYRKIARLSEKMAEILSKGSLARITSPAGTDIVMSLEGRTGHPDTGIYHNPGDFGNLPAGEAFIAPVEGTAQGVIVIDGAMSGVGVVEEPIKMTVESGYVTEITGGHGARDFLSRTSVFMAMAVPPWDVISSATAFACSSLRSKTATFAPLFARALAISLQRIPPPPVIAATFPETSKSLSMLQVPPYSI
jgi:leucyl aminopeptidase (aminopeptidase T)